MRKEEGFDGEDIHRIKAQTLTVSGEEKSECVLKSAKN